MGDNITLNEGEVVNTQTESLPVEEKATEEVVTDKTEPTGEVENGTTETGEGSESKRGFSERVRELNQRAKDAEAERDSLKAELGKLTGSYEPGGLPQYQPQVTPGEEITPERYQQDVGKTADAIVTLRLKQQAVLNRINTEAESVMKSYPQLDPEDPAYDRELSKAVTQAVTAHVKADPFNSSVKKFTEMLMKPYQKAVDRKVSEAQKDIAKQVSQEALKPTAIQGVSKSAKEMSIKELEEKYGLSY